SRTPRVTLRSRSAERHNPNQPFASKHFWAHSSPRSVFCIHGSYFPPPEQARLHDHGAHDRDGDHLHPDGPPAEGDGHHEGAGGEGELRLQPEKSLRWRWKLHPGSPTVAANPGHAGAE